MGKKKRQHLTSLSMLACSLLIPTVPISRPTTLYSWRSVR